MPEANELIKIEEVKAIEVFTDDGIKPLIEMVRDRALSEVPDMSTKKGRDRIKSLAFQVAKTKTALDGLGKELTEDWKKKAKVVDSSRKLMREELDGIKEQVRAPLTEYENREKDRIAKLDAFYDNIIELSKVTNAELDEPYSVAELQANLSKLEAIVVDESQQERELDCLKAKSRGIEKLTKAISEKQEAERKERELEELRQKQAEEERLKREQEFREQAEAEARQAAARQIMEREREAKAREEEANRELERQRQQAEQDRLRYEQEKEAAIEAERQRQKAEQERLEREAKQREEDKEHHKKINNEAMEGFIAGGFSEKDAKEAVKLIAKGLIKNVKITY